MKSFSDQLRDFDQLLRDDALSDQHEIRCTAEWPFSVYGGSWADNGSIGPFDTRVGLEGFNQSDDDYPAVESRSAQQ